MFKIICLTAHGVDEEKWVMWKYKPETLERALAVGHELTRDKVIYAFRVEPV